ncbi:MAG TPA: hypothetical protein VG406_11915 [Isosphaeraceae bacterium]|jgi:hypothetical protein|nr:hypothetical protein [Isosphaeraceae bacterium]
MGLALICLALGLAFGTFGAWIADQRGRSFWEGALLGFVFGPIGVIVEALLPGGDPPPARDERPRVHRPDAADDVNVAALFGEVRKHKGA